MSELVTLGFDEVDTAGLDGDGAAWTEVVPGDGDDRIADWVRELLPAAGWRELAVGQPSGRRVFAAPYDGGWALALLADVGILSADPGPYMPRPGKAARRAGLVLALGIDGDGVFVTLSNTSDRPWLADPGDSGYCHAWVLDAEGQRVGSSVFTYASPQHQLEDLPPGGSMRLSVGVETSLTPGPNRLEAVIPSLDLFTAGTVEV